MTDLLWHFSAGQYFEISLYADHNRGNTYIWHSWNTSGHHSRVQVSFEGEKEVWSGGCRSHARGSGWHDYCLNGVDFNHATSAVVVEGTRFRIKKQGYFRINAWVDQHGQGGHYRIAVQRNDQDIAYAHAHKWNEGGWTQMTMDMFCLLYTSPSPRDQ